MLSDEENKSQSVFDKMSKPEVKKTTGGGIKAATMRSKLRSVFERWPD